MRAATLALFQFFGLHVLCLPAAKNQGFAQVEWSRYVVERPFDDEGFQPLPNNTRPQKPPIYRVSGWYGRTGNNFVQFSNALKYAICCQGRLFVVPQNPALPLLPRRFDFSIDNEIVGKNYKRPETCLPNYSGNFFYIHRLKYPNLCKFNQTEALRHYLFGYPRLFNSRNITCEKGLEDALVIHIRSGDVFGGYSYYLYKQPPLALYKKIIKSRSWKKVILFTSRERSDLLSPIWKYLIKEKNRADLGPAVFDFRISSSLKDHIHTMWCARYFAGAKSTLSELIIKTSPFLKETYTADGFQTTHSQIKDSSGVRHHRFCLPGYMQEHWVGSIKQQQKMLAYDIDLIKEI